MRKFFLTTALASSLTLLSAAGQAQVAGEKIADSYICVFKRGAVGRSEVQSEANATARAVGGSITHVYTASIRGFSLRMPSQAMGVVRSNPKIDYCEQDQVMSLPPIRAERIIRGGTTTQPSQETPWGIARVNGGGAGGPFATAWIIDTGLTVNHPDLNVDAARSRSFLTTTSYADENGHGTHVAGTIAALNNSIGVVGVAPGAPVVAVRVLDKRGSGTTSGVIAGVDYVASVGRAGDVANLSLGGGASLALDNAVINAAALGVRFAIAAGNSSAYAGNYSPARANGPNVFTVSAFAAGDVFASFSNYGNPPIEFSEPGVSIRSTWLSGGYNTISGTSMATPHLAGLLLLGTPANGGWVSADPDGNPDVIGVRP